MGAQFNSMSAAGDETAARELFHKAQDEDRYENGHSYSGGFGMATGLQFRSAPIFATDDEADSWLDTNAEKWGDALAVTVTTPARHWRIGATCAS